VYLGWGLPAVGVMKAGARHHSSVVTGSQMSDSDVTRASPPHRRPPQCRNGGEMSMAGRSRCNTRQPCGSAPTASAEMEGISVQVCSCGGSELLCLCRSNGSHAITNGERQTSPGNRCRTVTLGTTNESRYVRSIACIV